jgi:hypothetical protein
MARERADGGRRRGDPVWDKPLCIEEFEANGRIGGSSWGFVLDIMCRNEVASE